ncbi:MAG TPA: hypothetical protein VIK60_09065, partial [Vicinamibacterales bacterium]
GSAMSEVMGASDRSTRLVHCGEVLPSARAIQSRLRAVQDEAVANDGVQDLSASEGRWLSAAGAE